MDVSSWLYVNAQTSVTVGALIYLYLRHNRSFYFVRNMLMISMAIALVAYAVFPTAPPRFMPEWGFFDSVADFTGVRIDTAHGSAARPTALTNLYAAVPSMHVAFALLIGWPLARLVRWRALRVLWLLYPLLMAFVIIATANHFILDALLGALTAALSAYGARGWRARARPRGASRAATRPERARRPVGGVLGPAHASPDDPHALSRRHASRHAPQRAAGRRTPRPIAGGGDARRPPAPGASFAAAGSAASWCATA